MKRYLLGASALLCPVVATAQEQPTYQAKPEALDVADRYRADFQPVGGRIGSFFLFPTLSVNGEASDNVRASDADKRRDIFVVTRGEADLRSNFSVNSLNLTAFADHSEFAKQRSEDVTEYGAQVDGRLDVTRDDYLGLLVRAEHLAEDRTSYTSPTGARSPVRYGQITAELTSQSTLGRLQLLTGVSVLRQAFEDTTLTNGAFLSQKYRDVRIVTASGTVSYPLTPDFSLLLTAIGDGRKYSLSAASPLQPGNLDRDSTGGRVEAGVKLSIASLLYGQVRAGYLFRNYTDPRLLDLSGASFGADLLWNVTPLTSIKLSADRRIDEASSPVIAGNRVTELTGRVDHELMRDLIIGGVLRYAQITPIGPASSSPEFGGQLNARYYASRQLSIRARYAYAQRTSDDFGRQFHENRLVLGGELSF